MTLTKIRSYLLPGDAEQDQAFRRETERLSRKGLWVIAAVEILVPILTLQAQFLVAGKRGAWPIRVWQCGCIVAIGILTALAARYARRRARLAGCVSGVLAGTTLISFSLILHGAGEVGDHHISGQIITVLLVGVGSLPLQPLHTLIVGFCLWVYYVLAGAAALRWNVLSSVDPDGTQSIFIVTTILISAALTALLYAERWSSFQAHREAVRVSESLCQAQSRVLLAENAASLGRLAAALSHELNNPIGALRSAVDTLLVLAARMATSPPDEHQRLVILQAELRRSVIDSARRLQQIVARLQRFTNLDKADIQPADLNALIGDVVALAEPEIKGKVNIELELQPLQPLLCRPQQLSAVFANLLHNAVVAIANGDGRVRISTRDQNSHVEVRISDNGRGMPADELGAIFDPGFKVAGNRVLTGNWSLFSSRQIVREHGGDIHIHSAEGQGTTVSVTLPRLSEQELERRPGLPA